eukprot:GILJ01007212.1.p1 GENE.GILJ01007212.1~~GILJ01007212.1.p1  ORF type:complete len:2830 (-),score=488.81 GILJ01007212.1:146-7546(-)
MTSSKAIWLVEELDHQIEDLIIQGEMSLTVAQPRKGSTLSSVAKSETPTAVNFQEDQKLVQLSQTYQTFLLRKFELEKERQVLERRRTDLAEQISPIQNELAEARKTTPMEEYLMKELEYLRKRQESYSEQRNDLENLLDHWKIQAVKKKEGSVNKGIQYFQVQLKNDELFNQWREREDTIRDCDSKLNQIESFFEDVIAKEKALTESYLSTDISALMAEIENKKNHIFSRVQRMPELLAKYTTQLDVIERRFDGVLKLQEEEGQLLTRISDLSNPLVSTNIMTIRRQKIRDMTLKRTSSLASSELMRMDSDQSLASPLSSPTNSKPPLVSTTSQASIQMEPYADLVRDNPTAQEQAQQESMASQLNQLQIDLESNKGQRRKAIMTVRQMLDGLDAQFAGEEGVMMEFQLSEDRQRVREVADRVHRFAWKIYLADTLLRNAALRQRIEHLGGRAVAAKSKYKTIEDIVIAGDEPVRNDLLYKEKLSKKEERKLLIQMRRSEKKEKQIDQVIKEHTRKKERKSADTDSMRNKIREVVHAIELVYRDCEQHFPALVEQIIDSFDDVKRKTQFMNYLRLSRILNRALVNYEESKKRQRRAERDQTPVEVATPDDTSLSSAHADVNDSTIESSHPAVSSSKMPDASTTTTGISPPSITAEASVSVAVQRLVPSLSSEQPPSSVTAEELKGSPIESISSHPSVSIPVVQQVSAPTMLPDSRQPLSIDSVIESTSASNPPLSSPSNVLTNSSAVNSKLTPRSPASAAASSASAFSFNRSGSNLESAQQSSQSAVAPPVREIARPAESLDSGMSGSEIDSTQNQLKAKPKRRMRRPRTPPFVMPSSGTLKDLQLDNVNLYSANQRKKELRTTAKANELLETKMSALKKRLERYKINVDDFFKKQDMLAKAIKMSQEAPAQARRPSIIGRSSLVGPNAIIERDEKDESSPRHPVYGRAKNQQSGSVLNSYEHNPFLQSASIFDESNDLSDSLPSSVHDTPLQSPHRMRYVGKTQSQSSLFSGASEDQSPRGAASNKAVADTTSSATTTNKNPVWRVGLGGAEKDQNDDIMNTLTRSASHQDRLKDMTTMMDSSMQKVGAIFANEVKTVEQRKLEHRLQDLDRLLNWWQDRFEASQAESAIPNNGGGGEQSNQNPGRHGPGAHRPGRRHSIQVAAANHSPRSLPPSVVDPKYVLSSAAETAPVSTAFTIRAAAQPTAPAVGAHAAEESSNKGSPVLGTTSRRTSLVFIGGSTGLESVQAGEPAANPSNLIGVKSHVRPNASITIGPKKSHHPKPADSGVESHQVRRRGSRRPEPIPTEPTVDSPAVPSPQTGSTNDFSLHASLSLSQGPPSADQILDSSISELLAKVRAGQSIQKERGEEEDGLVPADDMDHTSSREHVYTHTPQTHSSGALNEDHQGEQVLIIGSPVKLSSADRTVHVTVLDSSLVATNIQHAKGAVKSTPSRTLKGLSKMSPSSSAAAFSADEDTSKGHVKSSHHFHHADQTMPATVLSSTESAAESTSIPDQASGKPLVARASNRSRQGRRTTSRRKNRSNQPLPDEEANNGFDADHEDEVEDGQAQPVRPLHAISPWQAAPYSLSLQIGSELDLRVSRSNSDVAGWSTVNSDSEQAQRIRPPQAVHKTLNLSPHAPTVTRKPGQSSPSFRAVKGSPSTQPSSPGQTRSFVQRFGASDQTSSWPFPQTLSQNAGDFASILQELTSSETRLPSPPLVGVELPGASLHMSPSRRHVQWSKEITDPNESDLEALLRLLEEQKQQKNGITLKPEDVDFFSHIDRQSGRRVLHIVPKKLSRRELRPMRLPPTVTDDEHLSEAVNIRQLHSPPSTTSRYPLSPNKPLTLTARSSVFPGTKYKLVEGFVDGVNVSQQVDTLEYSMIAQKMNITADFANAMQAEHAAKSRPKNGTGRHQTNEEHRWLTVNRFNYDSTSRSTLDSQILRSKEFSLSDADFPFSPSDAERTETTRERVKRRSQLGKASETPRQRPQQQLAMEFHADGSVTINGSLLRPKDVPAGYLTHLKKIYENRLRSKPSAVKQQPANHQVNLRVAKLLGFLPTESSNHIDSTLAQLPLAVEGEKRVLTAEQRKRIISDSSYFASGQEAEQEAEFWRTRTRANVFPVPDGELSGYSSGETTNRKFKVWKESLPRGFDRSLQRVAVVNVGFGHNDNVEENAITQRSANDKAFKANALTAPLLFDHQLSRQEIFERYISGKAHKSSNSDFESSKPKLDDHLMQTPGGRRLQLRPKQFVDTIHDLVAEPDQESVGSDFGSPGKEELFAQLKNKKAPFKRFYKMYPELKHHQAVVNRMLGVDSTVPDDSPSFMQSDSSQLHPMEVVYDQAMKRFFKRQRAGERMQRDFGLKLPQIKTLPLGRRFLNPYEPKTARGRLEGTSPKDKELRLPRLKMPDYHPPGRETMTARSKEGHRANVVNINVDDISAPVPPTADKLSQKFSPRKHVVRVGDRLT